MSVFKKFPAGFCPMAENCPMAAKSGGGEVIPECNGIMSDCCAVRVMHNTTNYRLE